MGVSIAGTQGYEYQYKVTLLIYLIHHADKMQLFVEKEGNEDALLILQRDGKTLRIQIQVKREKGGLDIQALMSWLSHFEERRSDANLLQRLIDKKDDLVLFVTRSRCTDDTVVLKSDFENLSIHKRLTISRDKKQRLLKALARVRHGTTKLMSQREAFGGKQAKSLQKGDSLQKVLSHVVVWEEFNDTKADNAIVEILTTKHQIAKSSAENVYLQLLEIVREGKNKQQDIQSNLYSVIEKNKIGRPLTASDYYPRGDEDKLLKILEKNRILLLTGATLCGKSEVAKIIASKFFDKGYVYYHTGDVRDVRRFLAANVLDNKVVILEDPWGHLSLLPGYEEIRREVEDLLANLQPHHTIIVTTSRQRLLELNQTTEVQRSNIHGHSWHDLTEYNPVKVNDYWLHVAAKKGLQKSITKLVSSTLLAPDQDHLLQIGQLILLASYEKEELQGKTFHELEHMARRGSQEIADWIFQKDPYFSEVLGVLALVSTSLTCVKLSELAYIFSSDESRPSFIDKHESPLLLENSELEFPRYGQEISLDEKTMTALEFLEERQLIKVFESKVQFTHPNYFEAGRFSFIRRSQSSQQRLLHFLSKAVACISPDSAYLAANQFQFLFNRLRDDLKSECIDIAFDSVDSKFPAVEDASLAFLANNIGHVSSEKLEKLIRLIQQGGTSSERISWHNGSIPYISQPQGIDRLFFVPDKRAVQRAEDSLKIRRLPATQEGWEFIESLKDGRQIPLSYFEQLLNYKETFIRKRVVLQFFRRLNDSNVMLVDEIFKDEHPSIIFAAIRGAFLFWNRFTPGIKSVLLQHITDALSKEQVAIRAANLLSTFAAHYGAEGVYTLKEMNEVDQKEIWNAWGTVYPVMTRNLPPDGLFINTARFGATMDQALKYLNRELGMQVFESWFERIDHQISSGLQPDDFEVGIMANLLELTKSDSKSRKDLFHKLIEYPDSSFMLSSFKWAVEYWEYLDSSEQNQVLNLLDSDRNDLRWIKAVSLTRSDRPEPVVTKVLGESNIFQRDISYILSQFPEQLLQDCLNIYCGFPYPLSRLSPSRNDSIWVQITTYVLINNFHVGYETCLQSFLRDGVNGFSSWWEDPEGIWKSICKSAKDKKLVTENLIFNTGSCSCSIQSATMLWRILMHSYASNGKDEELVKIVASHIEMLQQTGNKGDLLQILGRDFIFKKLLPHIQSDFVLIKTLENFENKLLDDDLLKKMLELMSKILQKNTIRFFVTFRYFRHLEDKGTLPAEVRQILNSFPNVIDQIGQTQIEEWGKKFEYPLEDWIRK